MNGVPPLQHNPVEWHLPRGYIDGLGLSNNTDDATNDINIAPGVARSTSNRINGVISTYSADQRDIEITDAMIKQLDVVWAPGNGGGRSAESLADGSWHWLAAGGRGLKDTVVAVSSLASPAVIHNALPGGYTAYRRIGSVVRSTSIRAFIQHGDMFYLKAPPLDIDTASPGTSAVTGQLLSVPTGIIIEALLHVIGPISGQGIYISELDATDTAASATAAPLASLWAGAYASNSNLGMRVPVWLNASAQFRYRMTSNVAFRAAPIGWADPRGRDA